MFKIYTAEEISKHYENTGSGVTKFVHLLDCAVLLKERNELINHIKRIVDADINNTYNEPSISVFHRAVDEANEYVGIITGTVGDIGGDIK